MEIREIKHEFFTYRNGIAADAMHKAGFPQKMIFGVEIPQIARIAREIGTDDRLATELWKETDVRESRLLATYLFDPAATDLKRAMELCSSLLTREEGDMLAFRLLKRLPFAEQLLAELEQAAGNDSQGASGPAFAAAALKAHLS